MAPASLAVHNTAQALFAALVDLRPLVAAQMAHKRPAVVASLVAIVVLVVHIAALAVVLEPPVGYKLVVDTQVPAEQESVVYTSVLEVDTRVIAEALRMP